MKQLITYRYIDIIVAVITVTISGLTLLGSNSLPITVTLLIAYLIPYIYYRRSAYHTLCGQFSLSIAFIAMAIFFQANYWQSTVQLGTAYAPYLTNDALEYYELSHHIHRHTLDADSPIVTYMGYPYFLSAFLFLGISDIAYPLICNIFAMLWTIILTGRCVHFLIEDNKAAKPISGYTMLLTSIIPGVLGYATILAKEPYITLAIMMCICAIYAIKQQHKVLQYSIIFLIGLGILATMRTTYIYVVMMFAVIAMVYNIKKRDIISLIIILLCCFIGINTGSILFSWWGNNEYVGNYISNNYNHFSCGKSQEPLQQLIGDYHLFPLWKKFLLLPFSVAVQFIIPFPFITATEDYIQPYSMQIYLRMSYLWYIAAIPMLGYYMFYWWRKGSNKLSLLALSAAVAYFIPAFMTAGSVSRYAYCFVPIVAILGGYTIWRIIQHKNERKQLGMFAIIYSVLIIIALFIGANPHYIL